MSDCRCPTRQRKDRSYGNVNIKERSISLLHESWVERDTESLEIAGSQSTHHIEFFLFITVLPREYNYSIMSVLWLVNGLLLLYQIQLFKIWDSYVLHCKLQVILNKVRALEPLMLLTKV